MYADAANLPLEVVDIEQAGCRAAALCAAAGSGAYANFSEAIAATRSPRWSAINPTAIGISSCVKATPVT